MLDADQKKLQTTAFLTTHIRRSCVALVDGTIHVGRRSRLFWSAQLHPSARCWDYPIVTPAVLDACASLNILIDDRILNLFGVDQLCAFLQAVKTPLTELLEKTPATQSTKTVNLPFEPASYAIPQFKNLPAVFAQLQTNSLPGISIYLHGSMADLTFTPFSDVDDLVIIRSTAWQDPAVLSESATLLARSARAYQNIDALQHHGHWLLTEFDLLFLDQSHLPLVVLDHALRIVGDSKITFRVSDNYSGFVRNASNTLRSMESTLAKAQENGGLNAFVLKGLVGEIALMPAYLWQARGQILSKPEAIRRAAGLYTAAALKALDWATMVRQEFSPLVHNNRTRLLSIVARVSLPRRYQAERIFRQYALWVPNQHPLGLQPDNLTAIQSLIHESQFLITDLYN